VAKRNKHNERLCIGSELDCIYDGVIPYNESPLQSCPVAQVQSL
jgi:hypothetical protein